jgi:hypothetical protein
MAVTLLRPYQTFATGAVVTLPNDTETSLIAQGFATAANVTSMSVQIAGQQQIMTQGGNAAVIPQGSAGYGTPTYYQGPLILPVINLGSLALTSYETSGTAPVAGTMNLTEIYVPYWNTWTGIGVLNGTTVGTDNMLVALYGTSGALLANSAVAGALSAGASVMQNRAFTSPITLAPGRYFLGCQSNGTTATLRHLLAANGSNVCTSATTGTFGTVPATLTPPATFTTAVGVISQLYT